MCCGVMLLLLIIYIYVYIHSAYSKYILNELGDVVEGFQSEGCSLHVVALLDSIWIDKLHRLSLPTGKWAQLPTSKSTTNVTRHSIHHHKPVQSYSLGNTKCTQLRSPTNTHNNQHKNKLQITTKPSNLH